MACCSGCFRHKRAKQRMSQPRRDEGNAMHFPVGLIRSLVRCTNFRDPSASERAETPLQYLTMVNRGSALGILIFKAKNARQ
eukprot:1258233-Pyramimonas_sp.AAC.1